MRVLVAVVVVAALIGGVVVYRRTTGLAVHGSDSGPVRTESDTTTGVVAEIGEIVTFGGIVLENYSDQPATLERIRIDPPLDPGMSLVDVKVAGKQRGVGMIGTDRRFPPTGVPPEALQPLAGAVVPPKHVDPGWGIEVFMGFKLNRPGQFGFHHALIDYRVGGKRHRIRVDDGFVICGPGQNFPRNCDLESFGELDD